MNYNLTPKSLIEYFRNDCEQNANGSFCERHLTCTCSNTFFAIKYYGKLSKSFIGKVHIEDKDSSYGSGVVIAAICSGCKNEIVIFNSFTDGYNSENSNIVFDYNKIRNNQDLFTCFKCKETFYAVIMKYEYSGIDDLEKDDIKDIGNAFSWIWINLECKSCNKNYHKFLDYETG
jgi:hypothetical protein